MTGATSVAGNAYPSRESEFTHALLFIGVCVLIL